MPTTMEEMAKSLREPSSAPEPTDTPDIDPETFAAGEEAQDALEAFGDPDPLRDDDKSDEPPVGNENVDVASKGEAPSRLDALESAIVTLVQAVTTLANGGTKKEEAAAEEAIEDLIPEEEVADFLANPNTYLNKLRKEFKQSVREEAQRLREQEMAEAKQTEDVANKYYAAHKDEFKAMHEMGTGKVYLDIVNRITVLKPQLTHAQVYDEAMKEYKSLLAAFGKSAGAAPKNGGGKLMAPATPGARSFEVKQADSIFDQMGKALGIRAPENLRKK